MLEDLSNTIDPEHSVSLACKLGYGFLLEVPFCEGPKGKGRMTGIPSLLEEQRNSLLVTEF